MSRVDRQLQQELGAALQSQGKDYEPRTHHLDDDGRPVYTNRLIRETSPYLLQHAHNPVNWFPWGEEALEKAKREDKPIFLSVGYSTCHWCHVMERESFEDEETARYINEHFVPIKVDREERPDIDDIYMKAVHLMRGRGGWPMTVVLTPDREPFFGGTYFPRARLMRILRELVERYETEREEVAEKAERLAQRIRRVTAPGRPAGVPGPRTLVRAAEQLAERFEPNHGGFGRAPKFPQPARLKLLLRYYRRSEDPGARHMLVHTLESMASGGIHDHVGGGFHRYSTDAQWLVPHFEKMLYTNAQLADVYLEGWQATGHGRFAEVARAVLDYVSVEMTSPEGGFYSATDADSPTPDGEEEEGYFFTWTPAEIERVVRPERARLVAAYYGVREQGNFEGRNIFHTPRPIDEVARESGIEPAAFRRELEQAREQLYQARLERAAPHRDGKILTAWNALMASAFARGALALDHDRYATAASEAAQFLWTHLRDDAGRLLRSYKDGEARHRAYLIDYAAFIRTALDLYEVTSKPAWLDRALALQKQLDAHYLDDERGAYFRTADDHEQLLTRQKPGDDGSVPSGNSLQAHNLLRLFELTGNDQWNKRAEDLLSAFGRELRRHPSGRSQMLVALDFYLDVPLEIAIVSPEGQEPHDLLNELRQGFVPNGVLVNVSEADLGEHEERVPLLEGKTPRDGKPTAYVCERGRCELPTNDAATFARQVRRVRRPLAGERVPPLDVAGK